MDHLWQIYKQVRLTEPNEGVQNRFVYINDTYVK